MIKVLEEIRARHQALVDDKAARATKYHALEESVRRLGVESDALQSNLQALGLDALKKQNAHKGSMTNWTAQLKKLEDDAAEIKKKMNEAEEHLKFQMQQAQTNSAAKEEELAKVKKERDLQAADLDVLVGKAKMGADPSKMVFLKNVCEKVKGGAEISGPDASYILQNFEITREEKTMLEGIAFERTSAFTTPTFNLAQAPTVARSPPPLLPQVVPVELPTLSQFTAQTFPPQQQQQPDVQSLLARMEAQAQMQAQMEAKMEAMQKKHEEDLARLTKKPRKSSSSNSNSDKKKHKVQEVEEVPTPDKKKKRKVQEEEAPTPDKKKHKVQEDPTPEQKEAAKLDVGNTINTSPDSNCYFSPPEVTNSRLFMRGFTSTWSDQPLKKRWTEVCHSFNLGEKQIKKIAKIFKNGLLKNPKLYGWFYLRKKNTMLHLIDVDEPEKVYTLKSYTDKMTAKKSPSRTTKKARKHPDEETDKSSSEEESGSDEDDEDEDEEEEEAEKQKEVVTVSDNDDEEEEEE